MDDADLLTANGLSVLEGESQDTLRSLTGDKLDALNDAIDDNMLNARVFTLGVLSDQNGIDVVIGGLVASDGSAGSQVSEEVECSSESKVQGDMSLANGGLERHVSHWVIRKTQTVTDLRPW